MQLVMVTHPRVKGLVLPMDPINVNVVTGSVILSFKSCSYLQVHYGYFKTASFEIVSYGCFTLT